MKNALAKRFVLYAFAASLLSPPSGRSDVVWHVSFKVILDASGNRPDLFGIQIADSDLDAQIEFANTNPYFLSRGFRLVRDAILDLPDVSQWFGDPDTNGWTRSDLQSAAEADPDLYQWRTNAINVYVNQDNAGGMTGDIIQLGGSKIMSTPWTVLHEIGHFMSLKHTHQGQESYNADGTECSEEDLEDCLCYRFVPGDDDGIADTLPDHECWVWTDIATNAFPTEFSAGTMTAVQSNQVDSVRYNIMSYHSDRDRFTSDQLDAMADTAATTRTDVADNRTWFVDIASASPETGLSSGPFDEVQEAVDASGRGDVLIIRPGNYNEVLTISKAVTLRASRGNAIIGQNSL